MRYAVVTKCVYVVHVEADNEDEAREKAETEMNENTPDVYFEADQVFEDPEEE